MADKHFRLLKGFPHREVGSWPHRLGYFSSTPVWLCRPNTRPQFFSYCPVKNTYWQHAPGKAISTAIFYAFLFPESGGQMTAVYYLDRHLEVTLCRWSGGGDFIIPTYHTITYNIDYNISYRFFVLLYEQWLIWRGNIFKKFDFTFVW